MLKINDKNVDCISKKEIKVIKSIVNKNEGFGIEINVNFTINNINGYFTLNFAHENNNNINTFINKTYKGNWYSDNGDILLEIFDTNNFYDSEIMEDITIKLNYELEKIHALITLNDEHINLIYDDLLKKYRLILQPIFFFS